MLECGFHATQEIKDLVIAIKVACTSIKQLSYQDTIDE